MRIETIEEIRVYEYVGDNDHAFRLTRTRTRTLQSPRSYNLGIKSKGRLRVFFVIFVASFVDEKEKTRIRLRTETTPGHVGTRIGTKTKIYKAHDKDRDKGPASRGSQDTRINVYVHRKWPKAG